MRRVTPSLTVGLLPQTREASARGTVSPKRMGVKPPHGLTPYGHLRGLPQSFTRSQKERPLTENILTPNARPLVANVLHHDDEFATGDFFISSSVSGGKWTTR